MTLTDNKLIARQFMKKVEQTINSYGMVEKGMSVLVGVSGGPDSMALLHVMMNLAAHLSLKLGVAHLNHCLRHEASDKDEAFVVSEANKFGLPCYVERSDIARQQLKTGYSLEEAGRMARYRFFQSVCQNNGFDKIAVGHNKDDNAELILLYLLRGSGTVGMGGIPPKRDNIIRPLIRTSRVEIINYLNSQKTTYTTDASNYDERFLRNKIRHTLIPLLKKEFNPKISSSLNRLGEIMRSEDAWINHLIIPIFEKTVISSKAHRIILSVQQLAKIDIAPQRRVLRKAIQQVKGDLRRITYTQIHSISKLLENDSGDGRLDLPGRIRVIKKSGQLIISKEKKNLRIIEIEDIKQKTPEFQRVISKSDINIKKPIYIKEIKTVVTFLKTDRDAIHDITGSTNHAAFFDWDLLTFPIIVRNYRKGDRFTPLGMTGTQTLNKFFSNNKINPLKRSCIPVFLSGKQIIWIGGLRITDSIKVTTATKTVLKATISTRAEID